jgi:hypothetical protein
VLDHTRWLRTLIRQRGPLSSQSHPRRYVAATTTSSSVVSSTPSFPFLALRLSLCQCGSTVHVAPLSFHFNSLVSPLHPLSPGRCRHPCITKHSYPSKQGCPKKWSASAQMYNHCCSLLYCIRSTNSRTDNVACLCAILQSGTDSRLSLPWDPSYESTTVRLSKTANSVLSHCLYSLPEITHSAVYS